MDNKDKYKTFWQEQYFSSLLFSSSSPLPTTIPSPTLSAAVLSPLPDHHGLPAVIPSTLPATIASTFPAAVTCSSHCGSFARSSHCVAFAHSPLPTNPILFALLVFLLKIY